MRGVVRATTTADTHDGGGGGNARVVEYASIFCALGVQVTITGRADRPFSFSMRNLCARLCSTLSKQAIATAGEQAMREVRWDGISQVVTTLQDGQVFTKRQDACGFVEGLNNQIRVMQRRAYGYRVEEDLRFKILTAFLPRI